MFKKKVIVKIYMKNRMMATHHFDLDLLAEVNKSLRLIDQGWIMKEDGYIKLNEDYIRVQEICAYSLEIKRCLF